MYTIHNHNLCIVYNTQNPKFENCLSGHIGTNKPSFCRTNGQLSREFSSEKLAETSQLFNKNETKMKLSARRRRTFFKRGGRKCKICHFIRQHCPKLLLCRVYQGHVLINPGKWYMRRAKSGRPDLAGQFWSYDCILCRLQ